MYDRRSRCRQDGRKSSDTRQGKQACSDSDSFEQASYLVLSGSAQLKDAFANVEIMYRIYLSLMSTNCSGEREREKFINHSVASRNWVASSLC